ncbi:Uncharacterized protein SCF082_LOCUS9932 [Durusdinium trenchii]|uniref:Glycosyltransferase 61 catalytic domain-containing protein n=1 Tax=Durusdinium trenchii TaxID=1381693 RepID=A0ABP0J2L7_9DINO
MIGLHFLEVLKLFHTTCVPTLWVRNRSRSRAFWCGSFIWWTGWTLRALLKGRTCSCCRRAGRCKHCVRLGDERPGDSLYSALTGSRRTLLWIQRATATTRRVTNEEPLLKAVMEELGPDWTLQIFSDIPPAPSAGEAFRLFRSADIVLGVHGSGQANVVFCRPNTGIIDINLPEPHSQYTAHNSYALNFNYRLVMLQGIGLHQSVNLTVPIHDALDALRSLKK